MNDEKEENIFSFINMGSFTKEKKEKILIVFLVGVFCLLAATPFSNITKRKKKKRVKNDDTTIISQPDTKNISNDEYISYLENRLEQTIGGMDGAGRVMVMITLKDGGEKILDKNRPYESATDTSKEEGKEEVSERVKSMQETVLVKKEGDTGPIIVKEQYPEVEGVVVLCEGGDNKELSLQIKEMAGALFSIEAHKIVIGKLKVD